MMWLLLESRRAGEMVVDDQGDRDARYGGDTIARWSAGARAAGSLVAALLSYTATNIKQPFYWIEHLIHTRLPARISLYLSSYDEKWSSYDLSSGFLSKQSQMHRLYRLKQLDMYIAM